MTPAVSRAALAWGAPWLALAACAGVAATPGLAGAVRAWFDFSFEPTAPSVDAAIAVWLTNVRLAALILVAACAAPYGRVPLDALVVLVLGGNLALVGAALGAYGAPLVPWLVHLPLELAGLSCALSAYVAARRARQSVRRIARAATGSGALLAAAAALETWGTPWHWP